MSLGYKKVIFYALMWIDDLKVMSDDIHLNLICVGIVNFTTIITTTKNPKDFEKNGKRSFRLFADFF